MSFVESLTESFGKIYFSSGGSMEARIGQVLEEKPTETKKTELLALPPVIRPSDGTGAMLYDIAYEPVKRDHPQHDIAEKLFNNGGIVPVNEANGVPEIRGVYETEENGSVTSPVIIEVFSREKAADELSRQTPQNSGEGFAGKALQVKRLP